MDIANLTKKGEVLVQLQLPQAKRYKPSRFNAHTRATDGTLVIYNSFSGHRCGISPTTADAALRYLTRKGSEAPLDRVGEYLLNKGYIVEGDVDENARHDVRYNRDQFRTDIFQLILLASEDCNFRCVYCSQEFKRGSMLPSVRSGVRELIRKRVRRLNALTISWFGGEPLLGFDAIEELAPFFSEICKEHDVSFSSHITTNGYLLTPERSLRMLRWGIRDYQITLDGTATEHDAHRPLQDGGATFRTILENIAAMKHYDELFTIHIRVNFDNSNSPTMKPLFEQLHSRLGDDDRFAMAFHPVGKWGGPNDDQLNVCGVEAGSVARELRAQADAAGMKSEKLSVQLDPDISKVCYAARPFNFVVGADGKLMKCTVVLDTLDANIVGSISEDGELHLKDDKLIPWVKPYYHADRMCKKCFFVPVCQGASCPLPRVVGGERPCPSTKTDIRHTLIDVWTEEHQLGRPVGNSTAGAASATS